METCKNRTPGRYEGNPFSACIAQILDGSAGLGYADRDAGDVETGGHVALFRDITGPEDIAQMARGEGDDEPCSVCQSTVREAFQAGETVAVLETDGNGFVTVVFRTPDAAELIADMADGLGDEENRGGDA